MLSTIQYGGVQTPAVGFFKSWALWLRHRRLIGQMRRADVALDSIDVRRTRHDIFRLMGDLIAASRSEIALLRTEAGRVLRIGPKGGGKISASGATRVFAHTHTNGVLGISAGDLVSIFFHHARRHRSTILIGPAGWWRCYTSHQTILGGSF